MVLIILFLVSLNLFLTLLIILNLLQKGKKTEKIEDLLFECPSPPPLKQPKNQ